MIEAIVSLSRKFRVLVVGAVVILLGLGIAQLRRAPVDEYPEFAPPQVQVQAEALGLSAAEVEQLITVPLEQDLLNGVPWLDQIRSESVPGLSTIEMTFNRGTNLLKARQMVQEHLTQAHALPQVGTPPVMIQPTSSAGRVLMVSLSAKDLSMLDLSILARWKIKPRLEGLAGVANVAIWGQRDRQLQVQVDPQKLRKLGVTLNQVVSTTGNALWVSPLTFVEASTPGTGGFVDTPSQRLGIQHITPITTAAGLSAVTIEDTGGRRLRLGQVAQVVEDHQPLIGDAVLDGSPGLMLVIQKFPGANTREVTRAVQDALTEMEPGLAGVTIDTTVYRPASFIDSMLHNLAIRAGLGLLLLVLLLAGYLLSWRGVVISVVTLVLSVVVALQVLLLRGASLNVMVLAGLSAGMAVVIAEAVHNALVAAGQPGQPGADLDTEIGVRTRASRGPLLYASLILLLLPAPALGLGGVPGALAGSLVLSYVLAVGSALIVAHVVTPALAAVLGSGRRPGRGAGPTQRLAERTHLRALHAFGRRPRTLYNSVALLALATVAVVPQLAGSHTVLPALQDRELTVHWLSAPGTSLPEMARITERASQDLRELPGVREVGSHVGRALMADQTVNVNSAELWVSLDAKTPYRPAVEAVKGVLDRYPGMRADVSTYPADRMSAARTGIAAPVVVRLYGHDLATLATKAAELRTMLTGIRGISHPTVALGSSEPSIQVQVDLTKAQHYGITPGDVRRASATFFAGMPVGSIYEDQKIFDVVVWSVPGARRTPADVAALRIDTPAGGTVRLGDVAAVRLESQPTVIRHDNISRSVDVTASVKGRDVGAVLAEVRRRVAATAMPAEFHAEVFTNSATNQARLLRMTLLGLGVVLATLLLLQSAFGSWRLAALVLLSAPLGVAGAVLAAPFTGGVRALGPMLAVLAVLGLTIRNAVLLVCGYQRSEGAGASRASSVERVTAAHLSDVLLTALLTAAVMLPFAIGGVVGGTEVLQPMARVGLAGLVSGCVVSLLVLPALYLRLAGAEPAPASDGAPGGLAATGVPAGFVEGGQR